MPDVRVVGRRHSEARCVICHGALREQEVTCSGCKATMHADCRQHHGRCPTIGCVASARVVAATRPAARPGTRDAETRPPTGPRPRPPAWARFGPYSRLLATGVFSALALVLCLSVLPLPFLAWGNSDIGLFFDLESKEPAMLRGIAFSLLIFALGGGIGWALFSWLRRLPAIFREVRQLLDETQPIPMRVTIRVTGSGSDETRTAILEGGGHDLELPFGLLAPAWFKSIPAGTRVYVYGLPPPGPYLIEVPDGRLALFHPD